MKTFITILGSALIIASSGQFAAAAQRHPHGKSDRADRVVVRQQPCGFNAYAAWPAPAPAPEFYGYARSYFTGGYSAPVRH